MTLKKIWCFHEIKDSKTRKQIGRINMVSNLSGDSIPHVEYDLDPSHQGKGIMTRELGKYLKTCKKNGYNKLMAVIEKDNIASARVCEKSGFIKISEKNGYINWESF